MKKMAAGSFKANCLAVMDEVRAKHETLILLEPDVLEKVARYETALSGLFSGISTNSRDCKPSDPV